MAGSGIENYELKLGWEKCPKIDQADRPDQKPTKIEKSIGFQQSWVDCWLENWKIDLFGLWLVLGVEKPAHTILTDFLYYIPFSLSVCKNENCRHLESSTPSSLKGSLPLPLTPWAPSRLVCLLLRTPSSSFEALTSPPSTLCATTLPPPLLTCSTTTSSYSIYPWSNSTRLASGVVQEFEADSGGVGITVFVSIDIMFANLPTIMRLQSLPTDKKMVLPWFCWLCLETDINNRSVTDTGSCLQIGRFRGWSPTADTSWFNHRK